MLINNYSVLRLREHDHPIPSSSWIFMCQGLLHVRDLPASSCNGVVTVQLIISSFPFANNNNNKRHDSRIRSARSTRSSWDSSLWIRWWFIGRWFNPCYCIYLATHTTDDTTDSVQGELFLVFLGCGLYVVTGVPRRQFTPSRLMLSLYSVRLAAPACIALQTEIWNCTCKSCYLIIRIHGSASVSLSVIKALQP